jgi:glutamine synthetase type III
MCPFGQLPFAYLGVLPQSFFLSCLLPFCHSAGVNGSGKHNNWSLWTDDGVNLLCPDSLNTASGNHAAFPTVMAGIVRAINVPACSHIDQEFLHAKRVDFRHLVGTNKLALLIIFVWV